MSKRKNTTNYQFVINEPAKKLKNRKDPKEIYKKLGLDTKEEISFNIFNFILKRMRKQMGLRILKESFATRKSIKKLSNSLIRIVVGSNKGISNNLKVEKKNKQ